MGHELQSLHETLKVAGSHGALAKERLKDVTLPCGMSAALKLQISHHMKERSQCVVKALDWASWNWDLPQTSCVFSGKSRSFSWSLVSWSC